MLKKRTLTWWLLCSHQGVVYRSLRSCSRSTAWLRKSRMQVNCPSSAILHVSCIAHQAGLKWFQLRQKEIQKRYGTGLLLSLLVHFWVRRYWWGNSRIQTPVPSTFASNTTECLTGSKSGVSQSLLQRPTDQIAELLPDLGSNTEALWELRLQ